MQTFLPYPDFAASAAVLDRSRLGKQRVETLQLLRALTIPDYGWQRHPATRMWMGHVPGLAGYGLAIADEWMARGNADSTRANILEFAPELAAGTRAAALALPPWLGDEAFHRSHRSNLVRKDPGHYGPLFPNCMADLEYVWPEPERTLLPAEPETGRIWILRMPAELAESGGLVAPGNPGTALPSGAPFTLSLRRAAPHGRKSPKRARQVDAFVGTLEVGDAVALPLDSGGFALATVAGPLAENDGVLRRPAVFERMVPRAFFADPARLQDPRAFFAVPG
ncbi:MSMEG_6728 family protein [Pseudarthrobacter sp. P1]|uniref:MSMEG_6728 family protein n=1 Tax=Pseudarthrobacter sp. P1 TaxID=3418418 RepID=UPI003CF2D050